jgi:hypothetical protein
MAADELRRAGRRDSLCMPFVEAFRMDGAALSTIGGPLNPETVCASNRQAAWLDELQLDLGEGPCWDAVTTRAPILESPWGSGPVDRWPALHGALNGDDYGAIFAFPLMVGPLSVGALDLYTTEPTQLKPGAIQDVAELAGIAARQVLRRVADGAEYDPDEPIARARVHQATGMVIAQLDVSAEDALLIIRGRAYASGRGVKDIATDILNRTLDFSDTGEE